MELWLVSLCGFTVPVCAARLLWCAKFFFTDGRATMTFG